MESVETRLHLTGCKCEFLIRTTPEASECCPTGSLCAYNLRQGQSKLLTAMQGCKLQSSHNRASEGEYLSV